MTINPHLDRIAGALAEHGLSLTFVDAHDPTRVLWPRRPAPAATVTDLDERRRARGRRT